MKNVLVIEIDLDGDHVKSSLQVSAILNRTADRIRDYNMTRLADLPLSNIPIRNMNDDCVGFFSIK